MTTTPTEFSVANPNFDGFITGGSPPDTNGAPGPDHYIQTVNGSVFRIYDKAGTLLVDTTDFQQLWITAGAPADDDCRVRGRGDPVVVYDHLADRWVLSQLANQSTDAGDPLGVECLAVSRGPNPVTDGWYVYTFVLGFSNDYPKIGVWPDGYYSVTQEGYNGSPVNVTVYDRATMLNGGFATFQNRTVAAPPTIIILPADLSGPPPAPGTPNFYARPVDGNLFGGVDRIEIFEFHVDWGVPANTTFTLAQTLAPAAFASDICDGANLFNNCIDQPTNAAKKEALSVWPMGPLHYRNFGTHESLVFNHTVDVNGAGLAGARWYELRRVGGVWSIHQQGTQSPPDGQNTHRWMGSIAMDKLGNMALGYSVSNDGVASNVFPGIRYAGRLATDPPGLLPFGEITLVDGGGSTGGTRWGDYSAMRVDPVDDCTFWYTTQYIAAGPSQRTRIGAFRFPSCNPADLAITKSDAPDPVTAGSLLTYTIGVTNNGPGNATNVVVTDTLPTGTTYQTSSITCSGGVVRTCNLGDLANGASTSFTITVKVAPNLLSSIPTSATNITNTATVAATEDDPVSSNNTATASTLVTESADLRLTKTCKPDTAAAAGSNAFCDIRVDNLGLSDAQNVVVTDTIVSNANFTVISAAGTPIACVPPIATPIGPTTSTTLACNLGTVASGSGTTIHVVFTTDSSGDINDTATVTSSTLDPNTGNNAATGKVIFGASSDLGILKVATPNPVVAGTNVTYTITVNNAGPSTAANVVVKDTVPAEVSVLAVTPSVGSCTAGFPGNPLQPTSCTLGSMAVGGSATITVLAKVNSNVPNGTVINNNATVSSAVADGNNANNSATAPVTVNANADLAIVKTSDKEVYKPSVVVTYTIQVTNNGPSDALAVIVTDTLPTAQQALYQSDTGGCTANVLNARILTCNLGYMPVGTSKSFNIYERINGSRGKVSNTAGVASSTTDLIVVNNSSTKTVTIGK